VFTDEKLIPSKTKFIVGNVEKLEEARSGQVETASESESEAEIDSHMWYENYCTYRQIFTINVNLSTDSRSETS
jgi:hypothetical protein